MGGVLGVDSDLRIEDAALMANTIARAVHAASPDTLCVVEGGPIVNPRQLEEVCQIARVDGYIGGSTIDRVPSESAIEVGHRRLQGDRRPAPAPRRARALARSRRVSRWRCGAIRPQPRARAKCSRGSSRPIIRCWSWASPAVAGATSRAPCMRRARGAAAIWCRSPAGSPRPGGCGSTCSAAWPARIPR